jgi:HEPN superfamily RiboL-PSP-like protein
MASSARAAFDRSAQDVERLIEIHSDFGGDAQGRRFGLEVLNKSAIVLITAIWEAYCEDIAAEALEHLVTNVETGSQLPKDLKKRIVAEIEKDPNELAMWDLADAGWKSRVKAHLASLTAERNRRLNTPKTDQINELFITAIGLPAVSNSWRWKKMSASNAKEKLDYYIDLRGAIAHRGEAASSVKKFGVTDYFEHVKRLVDLTGDRVNDYVQNVTGKPLWL